MATLKVNNLQKSFKQTEVLRGINLEIDNGDFLVLLGPSGCGKSTLLNIIAGLENSDKGEILIDEQIVNNMEPSERDIAFVFQSYALYPAMNVEENIVFGLKQRKVSRDKIDQSLVKISELLKIKELLKRKPAQLSGGQRQRVAMGRALVRDPKIFLFDEPLSNLDAKLRIQMRLEIKKLQQKVGVTSIFVTHDQTEAMTLADKLAVINNGVIEQLATPIEIYNNPKSLFVAGFIGSPQMNFIEGELKNNTLSAEGFEIKNVKSDFNGDITLGIRPEHLSQSDNGLINLNVDLVEQLGSDNLVYGQLKDKKDFCYRCPGNLTIKKGDKLSLNIDNENYFIFDKSSGKRVN